MAGKKPQQPELRRSDLGGTSQDGAELNADSSALPANGSDHHPVPEANRPGWQQGDHGPDQDKPIDKFVSRASAADES